VATGIWRTPEGQNLAPFVLLGFTAVISLHRLEENIGAVAVDLASENLRELDTAASKIAPQGARYPEELQKLVGR